MAKKSENKTEVKDETQNNAGDALSTDVKDPTVATATTQAMDVQSTDEPETKALEGEKVQCVALLVTLRSSHPQASYGRCGYRFNKETAVRIPIADIPEEAVAVFDSDPYLACEYECE